ncbi:MAG: hypothetical protein Q9190_002436 [Brigantiaea leucoxantha]
MFLPRRKATSLFLACCIALSLWYFDFFRPSQTTLPPPVPTSQNQSIPPQSDTQGEVAPPEYPPQAPIQEPGDSVPAAPPAPKAPDPPPTPKETLPLQQFPVKSLISLPSGTPAKIPKVQHEFGKETESAKTERLKRLAAVKESFEHSWQGYKTHAWLKDELTPVTGGSFQTFGGWGATLVDTLDTLWMMGLETEFEKAVNAVEKIDFSTTELEELNIFETTIRYLGGFLGAYDISGGKHSILLEKAKEVGNLLYGAFDTPNRMPVTRWKWDAKGFDKVKQEAGESTLIAEIGSLTLEFTRLAQLTGENKFYDAVQRISNVLEENQNKTVLPGLWPVLMDARHIEFKDVGFTLGGMADSTYEYLPKQHLLLGGLNQQYRRMYETAMTPAKQHIFFRPMLPGNPDILVSGGARVNGYAERVNREGKGQHLGCFTGGMVGLGAKIFSRDEEMKVARKLTDGCIWAYNHTQVGIMPEVFHMLACSPEPDAKCEWDEHAWHQGVSTRNNPAAGKVTDDMNDDERGKVLAEEYRLPTGFTEIDDRRYILRPEAIESVFILYRLTGDQKYQDAAWDMFSAIERATRTDIANAAIKDVTVKSEATQKDDRMESFWLAETLKYFYAVFAEPDVLSLDKFVL